MSEALEKETIGEISVNGILWRVILCHGSIQFWTDDTVDRINARYVLSATIPPEVMDLAANAARRHAIVTSVARPADDLTLEAPSEVEELYPSRRDRRRALASSIEDALREADMD